MEFVRLLVIICPLVFIAGFVDAIAGGGGIISIPAYLFAGLPAHYAAGCNKFSASLGTVMAAGKYIKSGKVKWRIAICSAIGAIGGASIGTTLALYVSEGTLKTLLLVALPLVAIFLFTQKNIGDQAVERSYSPKRVSLYALGIGVVIGGYDGLIGPGTGTFLILAFSSILGLELVTSSGCAKVSNLASNLTSVVLFILNGKVIFMIAIPAALCSMAGGYIGAKCAIKGGAKYVRYAMFIVLGLLFVKTAYEFLV
ncbi:MAG: sulfite exporter TauE/SafE family protein [Cellulosilyticaceae bacterium]